MEATLRARSKTAVPRLLRTLMTYGFMTFALDKNPVCSMVPGSKLTGEPDKPSANEGCQNKSAGQRHH